MQKRTLQEGAWEAKVRWRDGEWAAEVRDVGGGSEVKEVPDALEGVRSGRRARRVQWAAGDKGGGGDSSASH